MFTRSKTVLLFSLSMAAGCSALPSSSSETSVATAVATASNVKDIPAIDRQRYPDSIGFVYQGSLATIFWLQNAPAVKRFEDLERSLSVDMHRGLVGEILSSSMQPLDPLPDTQPTASEAVKRYAQWVHLLAQYNAVTTEYADALGNALAAYNSDPARLEALSNAAASVEAGLSAITSSRPAGTLPAPPPPLNQRVLRPGRYFADAMKDRDQAYLVKSARNLERAIGSRNAAAYATAFADLFYMQSEITLTKRAHEALAAAHVNNLLRGQPLDEVIDKYVTTAPDPDHSMSMDQLCLINQINLISSNATVPRQALVAALLLITEDHRQAEPDPTLTPLAVWSHVSDLTWLVTRFVALKADGTTDAQVRAQIDSIVASI